MDKKEVMIGVGVAAGAALLVLFMSKNNGGSGNGMAVAGATGGSNMVGSFPVASTVYVPTSSYDLQYNTYKGPVSYSSTTTNSSANVATTYGGDSASLVLPPQPANTSTPPVIGGSVSVVINPPVRQTGTTPTAPAPTATHPPKTTGTPSKAPAWESALVGGVHYATPRGGWNPNSVVDNMKSHGLNASFSDRTKLATAMGISNYKGTASQNEQVLANLKKVGK